MEITKNHYVKSVSKPFGAEFHGPYQNQEKAEAAIIRLKNSVKEFKDLINKEYFILTEKEYCEERQFDVV